MLYGFTGLHPSDPSSLLIATGANVIFSLIVSFLFYKISLLLFKGNNAVAIIGTMVYSLLANNNIYIRHILPYDTSMLFFLIGILLALKATKEKYLDVDLTHIVFSGLATGIGFTIYPGFYFLPPVVFSLIAFFKPRGDHFSRRILGCLLFGAAAVSVLLLFEIAARFAEASYMVRLAEITSMTFQGSFSEGFTFLPKYLVIVEQSAGALILVLALTFLASTVVLSARLPTTFIHDRLRIMVSIIFLAYCYQAFSSYVQHNMSWYGRLLHGYAPFLVWAAIAQLSKIRTTSYRRLGYGMLVIASFHSFYSFSREYIPLAYPRDALYAHEIESMINEDDIVCETEAMTILSSTFLPGRATAMGDKSKYKLVNFCYFYPLGDDYNAYSPYGYSLLYKGRHFISFPAYGFEGHSIRERRLLRDRNYQLEIYIEDPSNKK
jgi:hypothetical protein